ncbi:MAG: hypothetical protein ACR2G1_07995 [Rubrobacteraceae bacterium]
MPEPAITYAPRPDTTPEGELSTLAVVYRFILDTRKENAAGMTSTNGDDAKKGSLKHEVRATASIHEQ